MCSFLDRCSTTRWVSLLKDSDSPGSSSSLESEMVSQAKSGMGMLFVMVAASTALFAQSSGPDTPQNHASVGDAREIVGPSVVATERPLN